MLAIEERPSKTWARVIRGIWSIANETTPLVLSLSTRSLFWAGCKKETRVEPYLMRSTSSGVGCLTLSTTSAPRASFLDAIWAPTASYLASGMEAAYPAPDSTTKEQPCFLTIFSIVSGVMETLLSLG